MDRLWTPWRYGYISGGESGSGKPGVPSELAAWPGDLGCVFCNMIAAVEYSISQGMSMELAERAAGLLLRGPEAFLVMNAYPYNSGHIMAVPYRHEASLAALPWSTAMEMMRLTRRAETALRLTYRPDGLNLGLNLGESAGAGVAHHLHLHAVPRWSGDTNYMTVLGETRILPEMLDETWQRLRSTLADLPDTM